MSDRPVRSVEPRRNERAVAETEASLSPIARQVHEQRLTYLSPERLLTLERVAKLVMERGVDGAFLEAGLGLGGSAVLLASMADGRAFHGYDIFGMIPAPTESDPPEVHRRYAVIAAGCSEGIGGDLYYGYRDDLYEHVTGTFEKFGLPVGERVHLHKGLFEDTLHVDWPVAVAHIDSDWYAPVQLCLERITPNVPPGGLVILDDFHDYGGCRHAVGEFLAANPGWRIEIDSENIALGH